MFYFTRATWNTHAPTFREPLRRPVRQAYIHHSGGAGPPLTGPAEQDWMRRTQRYHIEGRGWSDIGYNHVIMPSGHVYEGRGWEVQGAHTEGRNSRSIGVCFAGNFELGEPTPAALASARELLRLGVAAGHLTNDYTLAGHRDTKATTCPGRYLYSEIGTLKETPTMSPPASPPLIQVNAPVVGITASHDANGNIKGYIIVCADGGVFTFGEGTPYLGRVEHRG